MNSYLNLFYIFDITFDDSIYLLGLPVDIWGIYVLCVKRLEVRKTFLKLCKDSFRKCYTTKCVEDIFGIYTACIVKACLIFCNISNLKNGYYHISRYKLFFSFFKTSVQFSIELGVNEPDPLHLKLFAQEDGF